MNAQESDGSPSLMLAVRNGNTALIRLLLFFGADPLLRNRNGIHALELAQEAKCADIESLLASYCIDKAPAAVLIETGRNDELISLLAKTDASKVAQPARQALLVAALFQHNLPAVGLLASWGGRSQRRHGHDRRRRSGSYDTAAVGYRIRRGFRDA